MLDKIIKLVHENAGDEIVRNPAIPDQYNDEAIKEAGHEINNGLQQEARQGDIQNIVGMFKGNAPGGISNNPAIKSIISNLTAKYSSKFGISPDIANNVAAHLVPKVLNQFINKTRDPDNHEFDLQDVLKNFTGNSNIGDLLGQFTGSEKGGLGKAVSGFFNKK